MSVDTATPTAAQAGVRRAAVQRGLRAFYQFLEDHPGLPLGDADPFLFSAKLGTEEQNRAEVDRIARILGVTAGDSPIGTHYSAARDFGAGVTYSAWAFTADDRDRCERIRARHPAPAVVPPADLGTLEAVCAMASASAPSGCAA